VTPERWTEIQRQLDVALSLAIAERRTFLESIGAKDDELRRELESLLAGETADPDFMNTPALSFLQGASLESGSISHSMVGRTLGAYRILRQLGVGGMGEVYLAVRADGHYDQQVAVKIVRPGLGGGEFSSIRFRNERQILAKLDHPNIAKIMDGGTTEDGLPYFVMELIEGVPITEYCDRKSLSIEERFRLFRTVCSAVHYAHQHLIVHRDIKPNNIMVTAEGAPKLLDFGIAKMLNADTPAENTTMTGVWAMTPDYASPEQLRGEPITTATDVYSLGLILYELLTGQRAHRFSTRMPHEMARVVLESEPAKPSSAVFRTQVATDSSAKNPDVGPNTGPIPSTASDLRGFSSVGKLHRRLAGDVDNIVLKALRKETCERYASADQLSEDIRRHLEGRPITASKGTTAYRFRKYVLRHKAGVASAALIFLTVVAGIVTTVREARIAQRNEHRAERRFNDVRKLANSLIFDIHDSIQNLPGATPARKILIDRALQYLDDLSQESSGDSGLQRELASAYERLGDVQGLPNAASLGDSPSAQRSYNKSIGLWENLLRNGAGGNADRLQLSGVHDKLAILLSDTGDLKGESEHAKRSADLAAIVAKANGPETNEALSKLARAYVGLGDIYWDMNSGSGGLGDPRSALPYYQKAEDATAELIRRSPNDRSALRRRGVIFERFAKVQMLIDRRREAWANLQAASAILSSLDAQYHDYDSQRGIGVNDTAIGDLLVLDGRFAESLHYYREQLQIAESLAIQDPSNVDQADGGPYSNVGYSLARSGKVPEGLQLIQKAIVMDERLSARNPAYVPTRGNLANDYVREADILQRLGRNAEALDSYSRARRLYLEIVSGDRQDIEGQLNLLAADTKVAALRLQSGKPEEAAEVLRPAIASLEQLQSLSSDQVRYTLAEAYAGMGDVFSYSASRNVTHAQQVSDWNDARLLYAKSLDIWSKLTNPGVVTPKGFVACNPAQIRARLQHSEAILAKPGSANPSQTKIKTR
jgi:eukaryotic-like serine/threonine-protein kinase